jgi:hypothetical protein
MPFTPYYLVCLTHRILKLIKQTCYPVARRRHTAVSGHIKVCGRKPSFPHFAAFADTVTLYKG